MPRSMKGPTFLAGALLIVMAASGCYVDSSCEKIATSRTALVTLPDAALCAEGKHLYDVSGYPGAVNAGSLDMAWCRSVCGNDVSTCLLPEYYSYSTSSPCPRPYASAAMADGGAPDAAPTNAVSCSWVTYERTTQGCNFE